MGEANPSVLVIDDDPEFRDSVARLLRTVRLALQLLSLWTSESMGNHDSNVMGGANSVD